VIAPWAKIAPARKGVRPKSPARRSVEQGPPESGRGAPKVLVRGSDLEGGRGRRAVPLRLISGRIPKKTWGPCSTSTAAPLAGMRPRRRAQDRGYWRAHVPLRGAGGTRSRGPVFGDATVEPAMSASQPAQCASSRSDPQRGPSSSLRRAIQAQTAWNLLRPPRDLCRESCQYSEYWLHLASRYRRFWLAPHARFIMLGTLRAHGPGGSAGQRLDEACPFEELH
jgi:hypothetical protein